MDLKGGYIMKTNYSMLQELLQTYQPANIGFVSLDERLLIEKTLCLHRMDILALRNLRDFVVLFMDRRNTQESWDQMSAITHVIDMEISYKGGEI